MNPELSRVRRAPDLRYQWAIAPHLSQELDQPAEAIAQNLASQLRQPLVASSPLPTAFPGGDPACIWSHCPVEVFDGGLIQIVVGDQALALWLQGMMSGPDMSLSHPGSDPQASVIQTVQRPNADLFGLQVAHARCCSLLRLGEREGLIGLEPVTGLPQRIRSPQPLPWLQEGDRLRFTHPTERALLHSGLDVLEDSPSAQQASLLVRHFQAFEAACRIFGPVKAESSQLAQVRLGLLLLTRHCLGEYLLKSGVPPLTEL